MSAARYVVTAPLVVIRDEDGVSHHFYENTVVSSEGLDKDHLKMLVDDGMLEKGTEAAPPADEPAGGSEPTTVQEILDAVGDDQAKAQEYLDRENAAEKPRSTLVEKLEAIANPSGS